jgi:beta-lactam-binding protein with PASTA domain
VRFRRYPRARTETRLPVDGVPPPGEGAPPPREWWPWMLAFLILVLGGLAAGYILSRDDDDGRDAAATVTSTTTNRRLTVPPPATETGTTTNASTTEEDDGKVAVPRVVGLRQDEAAQRLAETKLENEVREVFAERGAGIVVRQRPRPEQEVAEGTRVLLEVSKGARPVAVPNLVGLSEADAGKAIDIAGLTAVVYDVPSTEPKGFVVAQEPPAGERAPTGSRVRINVSTGAQQGEEAEREPPATVTVGDYVGQTRKDAMAAIRRAGLKPDPKYVPSRQPADTVVAQSPKPGKTVERGSGVRINVSKGPKPKADQAVPNVVGKNEPAATAQLEAAGFVVEVVQQDTEDPAQDGIVLEQSPPAGQRAPGGATVSLVVGYLVTS